METPLHLSLESVQSPKHGTACGDVVQWERLPEATHLVLADGQGSGSRANIAATMTATRALQLLRGTFTLRQAFQRLVSAMNKARGVSPAYTAFNLLRTLPDGGTTILGYEAPPAILLPAGQPARVLAGRTEVVEEAVTTEAACRLRPGDRLLLVSDGITQAGLGQSLRFGWEPELLVRFCEEHRGADDLPRLVHRQALQYWGATAGDDCTVVAARCREARRVALLTGPPADRKLDTEIVQRFLRLPGQKLICGGSTANLVARTLHKKLIVVPGDDAGITPPAYQLRGIDLVTEGTVTLNQLYNILDDDPADWEDDNPVTELARLLHQADRLDILLGTARNPAANSQAQRQLGVLARQQIVPLIVERLRQQGKTVFVRTC